MKDRHAPSLNFTVTDAEVFASFHKVHTLSSDYVLSHEVLEVLLSRGRYKSVRLIGVAEESFPLFRRCASLTQISLSVAKYTCTPSSEEEKALWQQFTSLARLRTLEILEETSSYRDKTSLPNRVKGYLAGSKINVTNYRIY